MLNGAAKAIGKLRAGGGLSPSESTDGLAVLNLLVDYFTTRKAFVYTVRQDQYQFSGKGPPDGNNPAVYQLGPSSADWPGSVRPTRIENANLVLTDGTPGVFVPLEILTEDRWAAISVEQMPSSVPLKMYCDYANPNANLYFWGQPTEQYLLQLFTWQQISSFDSLATPIAVPPGYAAAFQYTLAELVGPQWNCPVPEVVTRMARNARAGVAGLNSTPPKLKTRDYGMPRSNPTPTFNYRSRSF